MAQAGDAAAEWARMKAEKRLALVVGDSAYADRPLRNARHDAQCMARALQACGFRTTLRLDCDREALRQAIQQFGYDLKGSDVGVGLFYYAGHGIQVDGINYLVPVGVQVSDPAELPDACVAVEAVLRLMRESHNRANVVILDACRDNPFASRVRGGRSGLAEMQAPEGSLIEFAAEAGRVAADGAGANGVFTAKILKYISQPGLPVGELFTRVRAEVKEATGGAQVPCEYSSMLGTLYLRMREEDGAAPGRVAALSASDPAAPRSAAAPAPPGMVWVSDFGFFIDVTEVTNADFARFLTEKGNLVEAEVPWLDVGDPDADIEPRDASFTPRPGREAYPVVEVSWFGARAYCQRAGKRLPTLEEWQGAYQGRADRPYPWGDEPPAQGGVFRANYDQTEDPRDGYDGAAPVGCFPQGASPYGALDMAGNVWEWVDAARGGQRLLCGGSWYNGEPYLRSDGSYWTDPSLTMDHAGFRCAKDR